MKEYRKESYRNNPDPYKKRARKNKEVMRQMVRDRKSIPCMDCGLEYPYYAMHFDHVDPSVKVDTISRIVNSGNLKLLGEELQKCEVVCANCHAERTHGPKLKRNGLTPNGKSVRMIDAGHPTARDTGSNPVQM